MQASVSIDGEVVGRIGRGLVVLVGVATGDTVKDAAYLARKAVELRIFADEAGKFNLSALDVKGELLVISQFTLLADTKKGRRPSFVEAAAPEEARVLVPGVCLRMPTERPEGGDGAFPGAHARGNPQ
jgi:D-tyrosyl-tRNA(Tyr) deacylase